MIESLLSQALTWGFTCNTDAEGHWQVLPRHKKEKWQLKLTQDRWLLVVNRVPQIHFCSQEAIHFLERRYLASKSFHKAGDRPAGAASGFADAVLN